MAHILIDIDDTLAASLRQFLLYINKRSRRKYLFSEMSRDFREGKDKEYDDLISEALADNQLVKRIRPYSFALDGIRKLHDAGHIIHIASARRESLHDTTEDWLRSHGLIDFVHNIHRRSSDQKGKRFKLQVVEEVGITVAFDDTWDVAELLARHGVVVYLINKPWNSNEALPDNILRVRNFGIGVDTFLKNHV